jgi:hypothetical protein
MITQDVIKEIYKNYKKPAKSREELNLAYFADLLSPFHQLEITDDEIIVSNIEEFSPFKRFLIRSLYAVLEFDKNVAFVFRDHILFFGKNSPSLSVNFRPESKRGLLDRLFGGGD